MQGLILRGRAGGGDGQYLFPELEEQTAKVHATWTLAAQREKRSRTIFAQESMKFGEVASELEEARAATGSAADLRAFVRDALAASGGKTAERNGELLIDASNVVRPLAEQLGQELRITARFELPAPRGIVHLVRTHPFIAALSSYIMDSALDPLVSGVARRTGAMRTRGVSTRTTILLVRYRYDLETITTTGNSTELCEECRLLAFTGASQSARWMSAADSESLLDLKPDANIGADQAQQFVATVIEGIAFLLPSIKQEGDERAAMLAESHQRVRAAARRKDVHIKVSAHSPADILGLFVLLPVGGAV